MITLTSCNYCGEAFEPDEEKETRCDTCSLNNSATTESEQASLSKRLELEVADKWTKETIKKGWKQASLDSHAAILAAYASRKR